MQMQDEKPLNLQKPFRVIWKVSGLEQTHGDLLGSLHYFTLINAHPWGKGILSLQKRKMSLLNPLSSLTNSMSSNFLSHSLRLWISDLGFRTQNIVWAIYKESFLSTEGTECSYWLSIEVLQLSAGFKDREMGLAEVRFLTFFPFIFFLASKALLPKLLCIIYFPHSLSLCVSSA